jgi:glycosyltransferase involved in cell wall biosynthesis
MKIGMMSDYYKPYISGVTVYIDSYKRQFEAAGHKVYIFTFGEQTQEELEEGVLRTPGINIYTDGYYLNFIHNEPVRQMLQSMDVVDVHHPYISGNLALRYCRPKNIPIVFTGHTRYDVYANAYLPKPAAWSWQQFNAFYLPHILNRVDLTIVPSDSARKILLDYGVEKQIQVIPHGIDLGLFKMKVEPIDRSEFGIPQDHILLVYIGRFGSEKNLPFLLAAMRHVSAQNPDVSLLLVGDGPEKQSLKKLARDTGLETKIHFANEVPHQRTPAYYRAADIFVMPSVNETFGFTIVEAMACGLPVVAMDRPGVRDNVEPEITGLLSSDDPQEFASNILKLAGSPILRAYMGERARLESERFSLETSAQLVLQKFEQLIEAKLDIA